MAGPGSQYDEGMELLQKYPGLTNDDRKRLILARIRAMPRSLEKEQTEKSYAGADRAVEKVRDVLGDVGEQAGVRAASTRRAIDSFADKAYGKAEAILTPIGEEMIGGAKTVASAIDYADRKIKRPLVAAGLGIDQKFAENSSDLHGAIDHRANKGDARAMGYQTIAPALGAAVLAGAKRGPVGRVAGAAIGTLAPHALDALGFEGAADFTRDFADDAGLSLLQIPGLSSMKAGTGGATSRLLRSARSPEDAAKAEAAVARLTASEFKHGTFAKVENELLAAGVPKAEITRAFGAQGERFMRGQGELAGKQIVQDLIDKAARKAGKGGGHGEFLGEKLGDKIFAPVQAARVKIQDAAGFGGVLPGVSRRAPAKTAGGVETLGAERQRLRFMDQAEREARSATKAVTDKKLAKTRVNAPNTVPAIKATVDDAFDAGMDAGHTSLANKLAEITGTTVDTLPEVAKRYLKDFSPKTAGGSSSNAVAESTMRFLETFRRWWNAKKLVGVPGYTVRNTLEDAGKMIAADAMPGIRGPGGFVDVQRAIKAAQEAEGVLAAGGQLSAAQAAALKRIKAAEKAGVDLGGSMRQDLSMREGRHQVMQELAEKAGLPIQAREGVLNKADALVSKMRAPIEAAPAPLLINRKAMDAWEKLARLSVFEDGIAKGMPPQVAAERVANVLLDYGKTLGDMDRPLKNLFSFLSYKTQAPVAAARLIAANPGRVNTLKAAAESAQPYAQTDETQAPRWQQERGMTGRAPQPLNDLRREVLGANNVPAQSNITYPVAPINEMQQPVEMLQALGSGNMPFALRKLVVENLSPLLQAGFEGVNAERVTTGEEIAEPFKDFLAKTVGTVVSPSFITDHGIEWLANKLDKDMPDRFLGQYDNESTKEHAFLRQLLDIPGKTTDPNAAQEFQNATSGPEFDRLRRLTDKSVRGDVNTRELKKKYGR